MITSRRDFFGQLLLSILGGLGIKNSKNSEVEKIEGIGVMRYPSLKEYKMPDGTIKTSKDLAKKIAEEIKSGSVIVLPNSRDYMGEYEWDLRLETADIGKVKIERKDDVSFTLPADTDECKFRMVNKT